MSGSSSPAKGGASTRGGQIPMAISTDGYYYRCGLSVEITPHVKRPSTKCVPSYNWYSDCLSVSVQVSGCQLLSASLALSLSLAACVIDVEIKLQTHVASIKLPRLHCTAASTSSSILSTMLHTDRLLVCIHASLHQPSSSHHHLSL